MPFWKKFKPTDGERCPFCRKPIKSGRIIIPDGYQNNNRMCKDCFNHLYKNIIDGRTVGYIDDSSNIIFHFLPAPILEKPLFSKRKFVTGYEYRMPGVTEMQIVFHNIVWMLVILLLCLTLGICKFIISADTIGICAFCMNILFAFGSLLFAISDLINLIKGFFLGMGHPRRLILIAFIAILTAIITLCVKQLLLFFN